MESVDQVFDEALTNCDWLLGSLDGFKGRIVNVHYTTHEIIILYSPHMMPIGRGDDASVLNLDMFWTDLVAASKVLSHEATKFAIAHISPPFPDSATTKALALRLCTAASLSVGYLLTLPSSAGSTFLRTVSNELKALVANLRQFLKIINEVTSSR